MFCDVAMVGHVGIGAFAHLIDSEDCCFEYPGEVSNYKTHASRACVCCTVCLESCTCWMNS